ncbi:unnamed protein product [Somion occarium]|uniref:Uncharacterized protein n=1 Tax=Somion occarium TaxID=3059160 RepID=A0ABP1CZL3_9APHY
MATVLKSWVTFSTPKARNVVRTILANSNKFGLTTQDIYHAAQQQNIKSELVRPAKADLAPGRRPGPEPSNPNHPIPSMRYLKKFVLEDLAARGEIAKVHVRRIKVGEFGEPVYYARAKGTVPVKADAIVTAGKEAWVWRLNTKGNALPPSLEDESGEPPVMGAMKPEGVDLENDEVDEDEIDIFGDDKGWTTKSIRFKNVPNLDPNRTRWD